MQRIVIAVLLVVIGVLAYVVIRQRGTDRTAQPGGATQPAEVAPTPRGVPQSARSDPPHEREQARIDAPDPAPGTKSPQPDRVRVVTFPPAADGRRITHVEFSGRDGVAVRVAVDADGRAALPVGGSWAYTRGVAPGDLVTPW